jgi:hypothetical protein
LIVFPTLSQVFRIPPLKSLAKSFGFIPKLLYQCNSFLIADNNAKLQAVTNVGNVAATDFKEVFFVDFLRVFTQTGTQKRVLPNCKRQV